MVFKNIEVNLREFLELCIEIIRKDIAYAKPLSADLVLVSRANPFQCRTNFVFTFCFFICLIQQPMSR